MGKGSAGPDKGPNSGLGPKDEAKEVKQAKAKAGECKAADVCYVISSLWFRAWQSYCESGEGKPERIDNSNILEGLEDPAKGASEAEPEPFSIQLKPGLSSEEDYTVLSEAEWLLLSKWYAPENLILHTLI